MNNQLKNCLEETIKNEFVSVYHNYDNLETIYYIPYNASLTPRPIKRTLIRAMGLDYSEDFDEQNPNDIDKMACYLISDEMPMFTLSARHSINKRGDLMTNYRLDFNDELLFEKSYNSNKLSPRNPMVQIISKCSDKIIAQERFAQEHKMEKFFISMNMFMPNVQHDKR